MFRNRGVLWGIAGVLALLTAVFLLWVIFSGPTEATVGSSNAQQWSWWTKFALFLLIGLAICRLLPATRDHVQVPGTIAIILLLVWGVWQLWAVAILGDRGPAVQSLIQARMANAASSAFTDSSAPAAGTQPAAKATSILTGTVKWEKLEADGSVPMKVWSEASPTPSGCAGTHSYDISKFRVERQEGTTKWVPFNPGDNSTATRYMATEANALPPTFTWKC